VIERLPPFQFRGPPRAGSTVVVVTGSGDLTTVPSAGGGHLVFVVDLTQLGVSAQLSVSGSRSGTRSSTSSVRSSAGRLEPSTRPARTRIEGRDTTPVARDVEIVVTNERPRRVYFGL